MLMPDQLSNFCSNAIFVAAGAACVRLRSSRETDDAVFQDIHVCWIYDCYAAERRLRQLLQSAVRLNCQAGFFLRGLQLPIHRSDALAHLLATLIH